MSYARARDLVQHSFKETFEPKEKQTIKLVKMQSNTPSYNKIKLVKVLPNTPYNEMDGGIQWFTFLRGALGYPTNPSPQVRLRMQGFIWGIPYILRCKNCSDHAEQYLSGKETEIKNATRNRENLFNFFVDFHNYVNISQGKDQVSYQEAKKLYSKPWKAVYPSE